MLFSLRKLGLITLLAALASGCSVSERRDAASMADMGDARESAPGTAQDAPDRGQVVPVSARAENPLQGERAFRYLERICDLGPRPTGSAGMAQQQELLSEHFRAQGGDVRLQTFRMQHPQTGQPVPVGNLIVQWHPKTTRRILLCAHYDTRPLPDKDPSPSRRQSGVFVGANDGGSGTAVLMELAHFMTELDGRFGVDFLLVDAEEFVFGYGRGHRYFIGSEYFSRDYAKNPPPYRYLKGVVLDMIGDRNLQIYLDRNILFWRDTRPVTEEIWATAKGLGVHEFIPRIHPRMREPIQDDHIMLRNVGGIPTCEIIDFDFPKYPSNRYWHTEADTPDKCSAESLEKVGWVTLQWLRTAQ
jgi:hypothetical protein